MKYHKIGETFLWHEKPHKNVKLKVVVDSTDKRCNKCYFYPCIRFSDKTQEKMEHCTDTLRPDNTDVHFEKVK